MPKKLTQAEFLAKAVAVHGNRYGYSRVVYVRSTSKVKIICPTHGEFEQSPSNHVIQKQGCPKCGGQTAAVSRSLGREEFIRQAQAIHILDRYDYSQVDYKRSSTDVLIICQKHGVFKQTPSSHIGQKAGCPKCSREGRLGPRISTDEFIAKACIVHDGRYDYSEAVFLGAKREVLIKCSAHGLFRQMAQGHLAGRGCPECGKIAAAQTPKYSRNTEQFIVSAKKKHGEAFDYSLVDYRRANQKVKIICSAHGVFEQFPYVHLRGSGGCLQCTGANVAKSHIAHTLAWFIDKCKLLHPNLDFSQTEYKGRRLKVDVVCPSHGTITLLPSTLLRGHGCPKCTQAGFAGKATGWTRSSWVSRQQGRAAVLYVFKLQGDGEQFYKVGITYEPKQRIAQFPYGTELVQLFPSQDAASIYNLERAVKAKFKHLRYKPHKSFAGHQECYRSAEEILAHLQATYPT